jgi:hypothetical protein
MSKAPPIKLDIPAQDLAALSFCRSEPDAIKAWVRTLPMANLGSVTRSLYQALGELNRIKLSPQQRFDILENLRHVVKFAYDGLKKHYLNQPVLLPEQPKKVALLSEALINRLVEGYRVVASQCQDKMRGFSLNKPNALMAAACYRAISDSRLNLLRSFQLYQPASTSLWLNIHQTYLAAEQFKLLQTDIAELIHHDTPCRVHDSYIHINLLGCVKANQLRQEDIQLICDKSLEWVQYVHLSPISYESDKAFIIDPMMDNPPVYQKFYLGDFNSHCRCLDTTKLIEHLKIKVDPELTGEDTKLTHNLVNHIILAWGILSDRTFMRLESNDSLAICTGLSTTHFFVSGGISFNELIKSDSHEDEIEDKSFQVDAAGNKVVEDVWGSAFDSKVRDHSTHIELESIDYHVRSDGSSPSHGENDKEKYHDFEASMINISPGGYCLEWPDEPPAQIRTGEIIGIKEKHHSAWSIGVIRWVRQGDDGGMRMGVELLSPTAAPYGAKVLSARGENTSEYMRVMVLPEIKSIGQPMTMITPAVSFKEGHKAVLIQSGHVSTVLLTKRTAATGSFYQFEFQQTRKQQTPAQSETKKSDDHFDSLWGNL